MPAAKFERLVDFLVIQGIKFLGSPDGTPLADVIYKSNIVNARLHYDGVADAIRDDFNIAGVTRSSTGVYLITFDRKFANAFHACGGMTNRRTFMNNDGITATSQRLNTDDDTNTPVNRTDNQLIWSGTQ